MKTISGKQFVKVLERHGWQLSRIQGSHHVYTRRGSPARISIPIHGNADLKIGLVKHLMKLAGITERDF